MRRIIIIAALIVVPLFVFSQRQQHFRKQLPAGNYSGICAIGNDCFALVDDKAPTDGFRLVRILFDADGRRISTLEDLGYHSSGLPNRDMEGICYRPSTNTLFISGEADNEVYEYTLDAQRTGRRLAMPDNIKRASHNYGLEALTYDAVNHLFYTTTERPLPGDSLIRLLAFSDDLQLKREYLYQPDQPLSPKHIYGVSEVCALSDGRLLVMERQIRVPRLKIGASTLTRIYEVTPGSDEHLQKQLVTEFRTRLSITSRKFANFEGLCQVSPSLLLLIADSQNQYKGFLRDWFRLITINQ
jgi:hypothetical protein